MKKFILFTLFLICCFTVTPLVADEQAQAYTVAKFMPFEDYDSGAVFTMDDGSKWVRTWWDGPWYYLDVGQVVTIVPMTDDEIDKHPWGKMYHIRPYWIMLNPDNIFFSLNQDKTPVGVIFSMELSL